MNDRLDLLIARLWFKPDGVEGKLYVGGNHLCYTLEDTVRDGDIFKVKVPGKTAIPYGKYRVTVEDSPRFGPDTLTVNDVPNFTGVRFHAGNTPEDTEGCILVGLVRGATGKAFIGQSRAALGVLKRMVVPRIKEGESCYLLIVDGRMIRYDW